MKQLLRHFRLHLSHGRPLLEWVARVYTGMVGSMAHEIRGPLDPGKRTLDASFVPMPKEELEGQARAILERARQLLEGKRVLVVDDEPLTCRATTAKLIALGGRADEVHDGALALAALAEASYDLIVMDINMPVLNGYETTELIRQCAVPGREDIPILGLSSLPASVAEARSIKAGMSGYLTKPCNVPELALAITRAMAAGSDSSYSDALSRTTSGKY